jgi:FAD-linked sulfhydryl oxidase
MTKAVKTNAQAGLNNPNGFSPQLWGPSVWFTMHLVAATYPDDPTKEDKANYATFFKSLQHVLPCYGCRKGYAAIIASEPTKLTSRVFASRQALFKWTVDVHNRVNAKLKKPVHTDWKAWYKQYDRFR